MSFSLDMPLNYSFFLLLKNNDYDIISVIFITFYPGTPQNLILPIDLSPHVCFRVSRANVIPYLAVWEWMRIWGCVCAYLHVDVLWMLDLTIELTSTKAYPKHINFDFFSRIIQTSEQKTLKIHELWRFLCRKYFCIPANSVCQIIEFY